MTKDEAKKLVLHNLVFGEADGRNFIDDDNVLILIDKIYDDFESRTCSSCEHSFESEYAGWLDCNKCCGEEVVYGTSDTVVSRSFMCNKWEKKDV